MTPEELKALEEKVAAAIGDMQKINDTMEKRLADGLGAGVKREELEAVKAEALKAAEDIERKMLADSQRKVILTPQDTGTKLHADLVAFGDAFKSGTMNDEYRKLAMATDNSTGHYIIMPPTMAADILSLLRDTSDMEQVADVITIDGTVWEQQKHTGGTTAGRTSERGTRAETGTPTFGKDRIETGGYYTQPAVTQQQLYETKAFDIAAMVQTEGNFEMQELAEDDYLNGSGVGGYPKGILANATLQAAAQITVDADGLGNSFDPFLTMTGNIHETFLRNARWMMKRSTEIAISLLKDGDGNYMWRESIATGQPNTLFGYPVSYNGFMPAVSDYSTNPYPIIFGDFKQGYKIIISRFAFVIRDEVTSKGNVIMHREIMKGGNVRRTEALALCKVAAS